MTEKREKSQNAPHTFDMLCMTAAALVTGICFALPAQWPVSLVWAAIALYFYSETYLRGEQ